MKAVLPESKPSVVPDDQPSSPDSTSADPY
jgi:hypothetical protein